MKGACELEILRPGRPLPQSARRYGDAREKAASPRIRGYVTADDDELIDHPVEMAEFALASFARAAYAHDNRHHGPPPADLARLRRSERLCEDTSFLRRTRAYEAFRIPLTAVGEARGLGTRASTALVCSATIARERRDRCDRSAIVFSSVLVQSRVFPPWNVKAQTRAFGPTLPIRKFTTLLWRSGITSYTTILPCPQRLIGKRTI